MGNRSNYLENPFNPLFWYRFNLIPEVDESYSPGYMGSPDFASMYPYSQNIPEFSAAERMSYFGRERPGALAVGDVGIPAGAAGPALPGTMRYQAMDPGDYTSAVQGGVEDLATIRPEKRGNKFHRELRSWSDWWREAVGQGMGAGDQTPLDPLAQLQEQLVGAMGTGGAAPLSAQGQVAAHQANQADLLRQRAAGMGLSGIFDPSIDLQQRTIDTVSRQAEAAYRPLAWQQKQQYETQVQQMLQTIQQSEFLRDLAVESAGR